MNNARTKYYNKFDNSVICQVTTKLQINLINFKVSSPQRETVREDNQIF